MKILSRVKGAYSNIERYDLIDTFSESPMNKGMILCYILATYSEVAMVSLNISAVHEEIGVAQEWNQKYSKEDFFLQFDSLTRFLEKYDNEEVGSWKLCILYQDVEVTISGEREETVIGIMYPKEETINLIPLLSEVEGHSYAYNRYDKSIFNILKTDFKMSDKRAVLALQKLQTHRDIFIEFVTVLHTENRILETDGISVDGFTAKQLNEEYPLSLLGAYNYLIYLRECPADALADLKQGLPRK